MFGIVDSYRLYDTVGIMRDETVVALKMTV